MELRREKICIDPRKLKQCHLNKTCKEVTAENSNRSFFPQAPYSTDMPDFHRL